MWLQTEKTIVGFRERCQRFLNDTAHFRTVFMLVMLFDIRYLAGVSYYIVLGLMAVWSFWLMADRLIIKKGIFRVRYLKVILLFLGFSLFTVILHGERNFFANLFSVYWIAVCFFLFYGIHAEKSNIRVKKEMQFTFELIAFISTFIMLVSLVLFAIFPNGFELMGFEFCIIEKRFVGVIPNANVTAFYSVIAIVLFAFLLRMRGRAGTLTGKRRAVYIVSIVINSFSLILTDSNASLLFMMVFLSFLCFYELFKEFTWKRLHTVILRLVATFLSCSLVVASLFFVRVGVQNCIADILNTRSADISVSTTLDANNGDIKLEEGDTNSSDDRPALGHQNKNIDSGRYLLWRQALGLIEEHPVFGIGKDNIKDYGDIYLGGLKYTQLGSYQYVDFHNGLLTLTVSFGLVGLSLFLVFAVTIAKNILKGMFRFRSKSRRDGNILVLTAAFSAAYCVYSMFEVALIVDYTYRVFIFWMIIGLGMSCVLKYQQQSRHEKADPGHVNEDASEIGYRKKLLMMIKEKSVGLSAWNCQQNLRPGRAKPPLRMRRMNDVKRCHNEASAY